MKISKVHSASGEPATTSALGFINTGCGNVSAVELADGWFKQEAKQEMFSVRRFSVCVLVFLRDSER